MPRRHRRGNGLTDEQGRTRGTLSEARFFDAFICAWDRPRWYVRTRHATPLEDSQGYDFFIGTTDMGEVPIQVKSSHGYIKQYWLRHPESQATLVVVHLDDPYPLIRSRTLERIERRRGEDPQVLFKPPWSIPIKGFG